MLYKFEKKIKTHCVSLKVVKSSPSDAVSAWLPSSF